MDPSSKMSRYARHISGVICVGQFSIPEGWEILHSWKKFSQFQFPQFFPQHFLKF